jgi:hypothetical protein
MKKGKKLLLTFVIINVFVLVTLFSSASWSWLSFGIATNTNTISSSHFTFDLNVVENSTMENVQVTLNPENNHDYIVNFDNAGIYTIKITIPDISTASNGYCKILVYNGLTAKTYFKNIISEGQLDQLEFELDIQTPVKIIFTPSIGICSQNSFETNELLIIDFAE